MDGGTTDRRLGNGELTSAEDGQHGPEFVLEEVTDFTALQQSNELEYARQDVDDIDRQDVNLREVKRPNDNFGHPADSHQDEQGSSCDQCPTNIQFNYYLRGNGDR